MRRGRPRKLRVKRSMQRKRRLRGRGRALNATRRASVHGRARVRRRKGR